MLKKILIGALLFFWHINFFLAQTSVKDSVQEIIDNTPFDKKLKTYNRIIFDLYDRSDIGNGLMLSTEALDFSKKNHLDTSDAFFDILMTHAFILYAKKGDLPSALKLLIYGEVKALQVKKKKVQCLILARIADIYRIQKMYKEAKSTINEAIQIAKELETKKTLLGLLFTMGRIQYDQNQLQEAINYFLQALKIAELTKDSANMMNALNNIAVLYNDQGELDKALQIHHQVLSFYKVSSEDKAASYYNIALIYQGKKKYSIALQYLDSASIIIKNLKEKVSYELLLEIHDAYYEIFQATKDYNKALTYRNRYFSIKDSLLNDDRNKQIAEMNSKYQVEKREIENKRLKLEKRQQWYVIISSAVLLLLLGIGTFFVFRAYSIKKKNALMLERKNQVIEIQRKQLEDQNKNITDSIHYASRIQKVLLVPDNYINKYLSKSVKEYFVLYLPKDIVSGDFYWAAQKENYFYIAVCDCTGHGVPGAFMSLLNSNFLNEAIIEKNILEPGRIFDYAKTKLEDSLHGEKDGMDATLVRFNLNNPLDIQYAAAMHQPILIRNNEIIKCNFNKMPIGTSDYKETFNSFKLEVQQGDSLFIFSDGYADQFGGIKNKKLQKSNFYKYLIETNGTNADLQKKELEKRFLDWKNIQEQTDDVCLIGLKF